METYTFLREFADSWVLLFLFVFFLGAILWSFRPGGKATHRDTADIPFRNDSLPDDRNLSEHGIDADAATQLEARQ